MLKFFSHIIKLLMIEILWLLSLNSMMLPQRQCAVNTIASCNHCTLWMQLSGKYRNAGQTCVCVNRILVQDGKKMLCEDAVPCSMYRMCSYWLWMHVLMALDTFSSCDKFNVLITGVYDEFATAFAKAVKMLQVGNGLHEGVTTVRT